MPFWLSVIIGFAGWAYIHQPLGSLPCSIRTIADSFGASFYLCPVAATGALIVSVISDRVLTAHPAPLEPDCQSNFWSRWFSMAVEIACIGILSFTSAASHYEQRPRRPC